MKRNNKLKVISLFCGCGGSDLGTLGGFTFLGKKYKRLPFDITYAVDFDKYAVETYNANFDVKAVCRDICTVDKAREIPKCVDILIGGFPCQSFSTVNPTKDTNDARANLYKQVVAVLQEKKPKVFVCENVKGLMTLQGGAIIKRITNEFSQQGYDVNFKLMCAADYGVPQKRERVIIVGVRKDSGIKFAFPKEVLSQDNWVALGKVIHSLPNVDKKYFFSSRAVEGMKNAKPNMKRGLWQNLAEPCLTITSHLAKVSINSRDPILLVDPKKELYRRFTPREAASIQSFPEDFVLGQSESRAYKQIGNAVPPVLMWYIMKQVAKACGYKV